MGKQYQLGAVPLLLGRWDFLLSQHQHMWSREALTRWVSEAYILYLVFVEVRNAIDYPPRQGTTKVDDLMHEERHDARGEDIVLHIGVPRRPQALEDVEAHIVL